MVIKWSWLQVEEEGGTSTTIFLSTGASRVFEYEGGERTTSFHVCHIIFSRAQILIPLFNNFRNVGINVDND